MGLFSKTDLEKLVKYLNKKEISFEKEDDKISLQIVMKNSNYTIFPYLEIKKDGILAFCVNLKNVKPSLELYEKINDFNTRSKLLSAKINENILYLEYNSYIFDNIVNLFENILNELFLLEEEIDVL